MNIVQCSAYAVQRRYECDSQDLYKPAGYQVESIYLFRLDRFEAYMRISAVENKS